MFRPRRTLGLVLVLLAASTTLAAQQPTSLKFKWTKGEDVRYRSTVQSDVVMSGVPGMGDMTVGTTMVQVTKLTVDDVAADGTTTLRNVYESIKISMVTPMGTMAYDSAAPGAAGDPVTDMLAKSLGQMVGESFTMVVAPTGKVIKIDGMAKILEKVKAASPDMGALGGGGGIDSLVGEGAQRSTFEQSFGSMPEQPVKPGETWKNQTELPNQFGKTTASFVFTMKDVATVNGAQVARIGTTGTIKAAAGGAPSAMGPMTVTLGDGTSQGETLFDIKLGRVRKSVSTTNLPMTMSMTGPDGNGITMQAATKTTTTMELIEK
jgi:hypothetical protein